MQETSLCKVIIIPKIGKPARSDHTARGTREERGEEVNLYGGEVNTPNEYLLSSTRVLAVHQKRIGVTGDEMDRK